MICAGSRLLKRLTLGSAGDPISFAEEPLAIEVADMAVDASVLEFNVVVARAPGDESALL